MSLGPCHVLVAGSLQEHTSCRWEYPGAGLKEGQCGTNEPSEVRARESTEPEDEKVAQVGKAELDRGFKRDM